MNAAATAGNAWSAPERGDETDRRRAQEYALLAALLARAPDAAMLRGLAGLAGDGSPLGAAHGALAAAAAAAEAAALEREFFTLFVGVGRGELLPYASYYRTGFLNGRPLAAVRRDLRALGLERAAGLYDPEDHVAILCDVMAVLAAGEAVSGAVSGAVSQRAFFARHLEPWAGQFFADLATAPSARFYRAVGGLGATFVGIETRAFAMED